MKLKNQIEETDFLASAALERGAIAASAFGAGFGGSVWSLVDLDQATKFEEEWREAYSKRYPTLSEFQIFRDRTGPGAFVF